jgi:hypothetical protein
MIAHGAILLHGRESVAPFLFNAGSRYSIDICVRVCVVRPHK